MEWLEKIPDVLLVIIGLGMLVGAITGIWNFIEKLNVRFSKKPNMAMEHVDNFKSVADVIHDELRESIFVNQKAIEKISGYIDNDHRKIKEHDEKFHEFNESFKILYRSLWAILDHAVTGNSDAEMAKVRDELKTHIINT